MEQGSPFTIKSYNSLPQEKTKSPYDPIGAPSGGFNSLGY